MAGAWKLYFICFYINIAAVLTFHGEDSSGALCSNQNEAQSYIEELMSQCFNIQLPTYSNWRLCGDEDNLICTKLKKYVSVIPSCTLCEYLQGDRRVQCYQDQLQHTTCSIHHMVIPTVTKRVKCVKDRGQCKPQPPSGSLGEMTPVTTTASDPAATRCAWPPCPTVPAATKAPPNCAWPPCPTVPAATKAPPNPTKPTTEKQVAVVAEAHYGGRGRKCDPCEECEECDNSCEEEDAQAARMSAAAGVGLFLAGLVLGSLVSCCLCLCAPSLHRRSSNLMQEKVLRWCNCCATSDTQASAEMQNSHNHANASPSETRGLATTQPSPDTYHDLNRRSTAADSHTYLGLQPEDATYIDPNMSDTYDAPQDRITPTAPIHSPTYQIPDDNILPGGHGARSWPPAANQTGNNDYADPDQGRDQDRDLNRRSNQYNVLMNDENRTSNEYNTLTNDVGGGTGGGQNARPGSDLADHQYFVLEAQADSGSRSPQGQGHSQPADDSNYTADHNYFVLEKQNQ